MKFQPPSTILTAALGLCLAAGGVQARILNVPEDFETIQAGISNSENGDTVLVQPGEYQENLIYSGRAITVASLLITTGDRNFIQNTIIDGNRQSCVVSFENEEDENSILQGFTIRNGLQNWGGGIDCQFNASPILADLIITENEARNAGGGVHCSRDARPTIIRCVISDNVSGGDGGYGGAAVSSAWTGYPNIIDSQIVGNRAENAGALYNISGGGFRLERVLVADNVGTYTGGVCLATSRGSEFINVTFANNQATREQSGGAFYTSASLDETIVFRNCIVFGNTEPQVNFFGNYPAETVQVSYSCVEGGEDGIAVQNEQSLDWGEGNIDEDPRFEAPDNGDFHLQADSPCIDAGDPEAELDPDGTRADMGALPFLQMAVVRGLVLADAGGVPIPGANITIANALGLIATAVTDRIGLWQIVSTAMLLNDFSLSVSARGFADTTLNGLHVDLHDTLEVVFRLHQPHISFDRQSIEISVSERESAESQLTLSNDGPGLARWQAARRAVGDAGAEPWTVRWTFAAGEVLDDDRVEAAAIIDREVYIAAAAGGEPQVYLFNQQGELLRQFAQPAIDSRGFRDLAWDGEFLWGGVGRTVYAIDLFGNVHRHFDVDVNPITCITWDEQRQVLWLSSTTTDIFAFSRDGRLQPEMVLNRHTLRLYGLSYWSDDPDGFTLYVLHKDRVTEHPVLHKFNPERGDTMLVRDLFNEVPGSPGGLFITDDFDPDLVPVAVALGSETRQRGGDRVVVLQLSPEPGWLEMDTAEGQLEAGSQVVITLSIDAARLDLGEYEAELNFTFTAEPPEATIPVRLSVRPSSAPGIETGLPRFFTLHGVYPNPFNSSATVRFGLPEASSISLHLYDIHGRKVLTLAQGFHPAGMHSALFTLHSALPTGVYLLRLQTEGGALTRKVVMLK